MPKVKISHEVPFCLLERSRKFNNYDQRVFIIEGIANEGTTKMGLRWVGYDASRFAEPESLMIETQEHAYAEA